MRSYYIRFQVQFNVIRIKIHPWYVRLAAIFNSLLLQQIAVSERFNPFRSTAEQEIAIVRYILSYRGFLKGQLQR
jgi:hypothetical protein